VAAWVDGIKGIRSHHPAVVRRLTPPSLSTHTHTHIHHAIYTHLHTQGIFAALYGELSARVASAKKMEFQMEVFSAALSIIVGVLWIALIIAGKLTVVFGG
jgi:hypothetical protein